jgi:hypothetical protein
MAFVCGVDWLAQAKTWLENGVNPELLYDMPTCRLYVLLYGAPEQRQITSRADWREMRERILAKRKK